MKKQVTYLLFALLLLNIKPSFAATYYISNSGNDSNSGTSTAAAWQTITKLNTTTLLPGDSVLFETGGVFRGQINLLNSGATGQPVYLGSYGSSPANPVISGCKLITHWSVDNGNIYEANIAGDTVSNVFENKAMMTSARYPNKGFLTIDSSGVNTGLYDEHLLIHSDWSGAHLKVRTSDTKYEDVPVASSNSGWLTLTTPTVNTMSAGYGYYLDNLFQNLDTAGEWNYDTSSHTLFIYTSSAGDTSNVEATVFNYGINGNSNSFIKINGLDFENQRKDGALFTGTNQNVSFTNCNFRNCYLRAVAMNVSSNDTIDHCTFNNIMGDCLALGSLSNSIVSNNQLNHIGTVPGYGLDGSTQYMAISFNGNGNTILNNVMDTIGSSAIIFSGSNNLLDKSFILNSFFTLNNGSAIAGNNSYSSQSTISNNFIFNTIGNNLTTPHNALFTSGISLSQSSYISINHNTIANTSANGIYIQSNNSHHTIQNNVVYNSGIGQLYFLDADTLDGTKNNSSSNNIFYCLNETEHPMMIDGRDSLFVPGTFDFNYYCNPYDYYAAYHLYSDTLEGHHVPLTLALLREQYHGDASSKSSLVTWEAYTAVDTVSSDLIENGDFTNNFDSWIDEPTTNNEMLLDNDIGMDGGCMKFLMTADTPQVWGHILSATFNLESSQLYQINFSGKSVKNLDIRTFVKATTAPFTPVTPDKFFPLDTNRLNISHVFRTGQGFSNSAFAFEIRYPDSVVWLDNIHLHTVTATHNDSSKLSRLITNYSANTVNVSLGDSIYHDLDGKLIQGSYTLSPYSSYVLTLDSPLYLTTHSIPVPNNSFTLFPNPINPSNQILHYNLQGISKDSKISLQLIDLCGRIVLQKTTYENPGTTPLPVNISDGLYLFNAISDKQYFEKKILISH